MAEKNETMSDLWAGQYNEQIKGDDLGLQALSIKSRSNNLEKWLVQAINSANAQTVDVKPAPNGTTATPKANESTSANSFDLQSFVSENKLLVFGGLAVVAYLMFFSGGGGLAESTVVKRYSKK